MRPTILLTGGYSQAANGTPAHQLNCNYATLVLQAGGMPLLALNKELAKEYALLAHGLLLTGGKDVCCDRYGETQEYDFILTEPERDDLEYALIQAFIQAKKPIFGICRGFQVLNVYLGGSLWQDIPRQLGGEHSKGVTHTVEIKEHSILHKLYGSHLEVNSYHHQGLKQLADELTATAYSVAGQTSLVEAFEHNHLPIHAVQWHPERMTGGITNPANCMDSLPLLQTLMKQCQGE